MPGRHWHSPATVLVILGGSYETTMKTLILFCSALAAVTASWEPIHKYHGPIHHTVIHKGVPVEPAAVQHARAAHLQAFAEISSKHGYHHDDHQDEHEYHHDHHEEHHQPKYHGPLHYPVIHKGVPVEPSAVQHARDAHLQAFQRVASHHGGYDHYSYDDGGDDESGYGHDDYSNQGSNYVDHHDYYHHEVPEIGHDGTPLDTVEVEAAKAKHFAAVHEALARNSHYHHYRKRRGAESYVHFTSHVDHEVPVHVHSHHNHHNHHGSHVTTNNHHHGYTTHQEHDPVYGHHEDHHSHHYVPVIDHEGHPLDTPEVEHAKAAHLAAYHEAAHGGHGFSSSGHWGHHGPVAPTETPEVQHARALHLAAHAAANAKYY